MAAPRRYGADEASGVLPSVTGALSGPPLPEGLAALGLDRDRDALVRCPPDDGQAAPLMVLLHGAGGTAGQAMALAADRAEASGMVLLAPQSRKATWDVIAGGWGPDVRFIAQAMRTVAAGRRIDPARIAVSGFSDGASYALSLGLINGGLFRAVLAFSPGFMAPTRTEGRPRIFVSHGTDDRVLPISRCSRRLVPRLRAAGHDVRYREFDGGHVVPPALAGEALAWTFEVLTGTRDAQHA